MYDQRDFVEDLPKNKQNDMMQITSLKRQYLNMAKQLFCERMLCTIRLEQTARLFLNIWPFKA